MRDFDSHSALKDQAAGAGWFIGLIVVLSLLAIVFLVFSINSNDCEQFVCSIPISDEFDH